MLSTSSCSTLHVILSEARSVAEGGVEGLRGSSLLSTSFIEAPRKDCTVLTSRAMQQFWIYLLRCGDGSYYTGVTNDLEKRIAEHKAGLDRNSYTYQRRPVEFVYAQEFDSINDAIKWEKQLQGWSRKKKEALIRGDWNKVHILAMNKKNREKLAQSEKRQ